MARSADQVLFSIVRSRALVPEDRLQGALQTAEREEIPLERVLLREGLLKATACEHVIQSRAQRARSCTRCGEFTYLLEDQTPASTPCERCGGPLQPTVADGPPKPAAESPARRDSGTGAVRPDSGTGAVRPDSGTGAVRRESGTGAVRRDSGSGPAGEAGGGRPTRRPAPRPGAPVRPEVRAALAVTRDAVKQIADLARPVGGPEAEAAASGRTARQAPPPPPSRPGTPREPDEPPAGRTPVTGRPRPTAEADIEPVLGRTPVTGRPRPGAGESEPPPTRTPATAQPRPIAAAPAEAAALEPLLEDAAQRLHARLALELRALLAAEADATAKRALEHLVGSAEEKLAAHTKRLESGLAEAARAAAEGARVAEAEASQPAAPSESDLSAWSALVAERVRSALLAGEVPPAWEERARTAAETTAREVAAREVGGLRAAPAEATAPAELDAAGLERVTARVLESIWAHLEGAGLEGFPARVVEGVSERARAAAADAQRPTELEPAALERVTARVLESIWAHLESAGLEGFPARVVEGVIERARAAAAEERPAAAPPPPPAELATLALEALRGRLEADGLQALPERLVRELGARAGAAASAEQAAAAAPLLARVEQLEGTQRESHLLGAEERSALEARLAALERRLGAEPAGGELAEDPVVGLERRLAALEAQTTALSAQVAEVGARPAPAAVAPEPALPSQESIEQAVQVALDALEERLQARVDALVANLELRLGAQREASHGALPADPGASQEDLDRRVAEALEARFAAMDLDEIASKVAMLATAPVMHAIDQRLANVDGEVVKRITRQVYAEMRQMAEERRTGKVARPD